jgi:hypothetical protein
MTARRIVAVPRSDSHGPDMIAECSVANKARAKHQSHQREVMVTRGRTVVYITALLAFVIVPPVLATVLWATFGGSELFGLPASNQFQVMFLSSSWVTGGGSLYINVPSEYPLFANALFALVRLISQAWNPQPTALLSFEVTWLTVSLWTWLAMLILLWRNAPRRAIWLWLNPATLYFSLYCFDVFLVVTSFLALIAARDGRIRTAALWLGVTVALKGFALFAVPAFAVWVWQSRGRREAAIATALAIAPLAASLSFVFLTSGLTAMLYPFRFQAIRGPDGESSTWDVLIPFGLGTQVAQKLPLLPFVLEAGSALVGALLRPRTFPQFLRAYLVGVGGFLTFSAFYSPQFVLWLVAPAALSESLAIALTTLAFAWATLLFFPISYFHPHTHLFFRGSAFLVTVLRTAVIALALIPARHLAKLVHAARFRAPGALSPSRPPSP